MASHLNNDNSMDIEYAEFVFKNTISGQKYMYHVPTHLCIANFIEYMKNRLYTNLNISRDNKIEIVEAGQIIPNVRSEDAPALVRDFTTTVRQRYNGVYDNQSFYFRVIDRNR